MIRLDEAKAEIRGLIEAEWPDIRCYTTDITKGYRVPCFFLRMRLAPHKDVNVNITSRKLFISLDYFQKEPDERDTLSKLDGIIHLLTPEIKTNPKRKMMIVLGGQHCLIDELSSDYTGKEDNILTVDFSVTLYSFAKLENEPKIEQLQLEEEE